MPEPKFLFSVIGRGAKGKELIPLPDAKLLPELAEVEVPKKPPGVDMPKKIKINVDSKTRTPVGEPVRDSEISGLPIGTVLADVEGISGVHLLVDARRLRPSETEAGRKDGALTEFLDKLRSIMEGMPSLFEGIPPDALKIPEEDIGPGPDHPASLRCEGPLSQAERDIVNEIPFHYESEMVVNGPLHGDLEEDEIQNARLRARMVFTKPGKKEILEGVKGMRDLPKEAVSALKKTLTDILTDRKTRALMNEEFMFFLDIHTATEEGLDKAKNEIFLRNFRGELEKVAPATQSVVQLRKIFSRDDERQVLEGLSSWDMTREDVELIRGVGARAVGNMLSKGSITPEEIEHLGLQRRIDAITFRRIMEKYP